MSDDSLELLAAARRGVDAAWRDGFEYTKAGIMLDDLVAAELRPRTLFEGDVERRTRLMTALDEVNGRFGRFTAVPAAQGFKRGWVAGAIGQPITGLDHADRRSADCQNVITGLGQIDL